MANKIPMRSAVSMKKGSGTMLINISVAGSRIHKSLLKKILWKTTKYLEKSVDIIPPTTRARAKNTPVPIQRENGGSF